jgi:hypothetical protein
MKYENKCFTYYCGYAYAQKETIAFVRFMGKIGLDVIQHFWSNYLNKIIVTVSLLFCGCNT